MNAIDRLALLAELKGSCCELNHGPNAEPHQAIDYIVLPFGYHEQNVTDVSVHEMVIPVCDECVSGLRDDDWTLLYCFECNSSQWIFRPLAKNNYRHHILWLRGCPKCSKKFGGLYFNDFGKEADDVVFLKHH